MTASMQVREPDTGRRRRPLAAAIGTGVLVAAVLAATGGSAAVAAGVPGSPGYLGAAEPFAVLGGSTVTNTGAPTRVWGDVGVAPGTAIVGFQTSQVGGTQHAADSTAGSAQIALTDAYGAAAAATPSDSVNHATVGNLTFLPGVYNATSTMDLTGTVILDGGGDAAATWVFQAGSTLTTASSSRVVVINGNPCNVYWQVGSSAALGSSTAFIGTVLANDAITAVTSATVEGRLLARNAAVTLDSNQITQPVCSLTDGNGALIPAPAPSPSATTAAPSASATPTASPSATPTASAPVTAAPSATPSRPAPTARPTTAPTRTPRTPSATPTPSVTPTPTLPAGSGPGPAPTPTVPSLATTGSDVTPPLGLAGGLLAAGALLIAAPAFRRSIRRRSAARD